MSESSVQILAEIPCGGQDSFYEFSEESSSLGVPVIVKVVPVEGKPWVGLFYARNPYPKAVSAAVALNNSSLLIVVSHGTGYVVDVNLQTDYNVVPVYPIMRILDVARHGVFLLCSFTDCVAYGRSGLLWEKSRIVDDELIVSGGPDDTIQIEGWDFASDKRVVKIVGLKDGEIRKVL